MYLLMVAGCRDSAEKRQEVPVSIYNFLSQGLYTRSDLSTDTSFGSAGENHNELNILDNDLMEKVQTS